MSGWAIAVGLWYFGSSMAVEFGVFLSWAGVDADSSGFIARSHNVVKLWELSEIANTTKLSITVDRSENFLRMSISVGILTSPTVASDEDPE